MFGFIVVQLSLLEPDGNEKFRVVKKNNQILLDEIWTKNLVIVLLVNFSAI